MKAMKECDGVYFGAIGGAGALLAKCIKRAELIAYEDLGAEACANSMWRICRWSSSLTARATTCTNPAGRPICAKGTGNNRSRLCGRQAVSPLTFGKPVLLITEIASLWLRGSAGRFRGLKRNGVKVPTRKRRCKCRCVRFVGGSRSLGKPEKADPDTLEAQVRRPTGRKDRGTLLFVCVA